MARQRSVHHIDAVEASTPLTERRFSSVDASSARVAEACLQALPVGGGSGTSSTIEPKGACSTWGTGLAEESIDGVADATAIANPPKCGQQWPGALPCNPLPTHPAEEWLMAAECAG